MKPYRRSYPILCLATLLLGAIACGGDGGGGDGESFIVTGLWTMAPTGVAAATPNNADCNDLASGVGAFPGRELQVTQLDGTVTATGGFDEFNGTVNTSDQSFQLLDAQETVIDLGATIPGCVVTAIVNIDFFNAAGDSADPVNEAGGFTGNSACPFQCTLVFNTTAVRS